LFKPNIYIQFLLCDISPLDKNYKLNDLVSHVSEISDLKEEQNSGKQGVMTTFLQALDGFEPDNGQDPAAIEKDFDLPSDFVNDGSTEAKFRICAYKEYIRSRRSALESIKKGMQLNGKSLVSR
jgi:hypothetical protein